MPGGGQAAAAARRRRRSGDRRRAAEEDLPELGGGRAGGDVRTQHARALPLPPHHIVTEFAEGDIGAGGRPDRGAQRRPCLRLVPQGQAQEGAERRHRRPAVG